MTNKKPSTNRIQSSLIKHLEKYGIIQLQLPDNFVLEIGINNDDDDSGNAKKTENYCYVIVKNDIRATVIDKYNIGIRCEDSEKSVILEDKFVDNDGNKVRSINVV
jgi:hypothetical protein